MTFALALGLASGGVRLVIGWLVLLNQVLHEPDRPNYPNADRRLRAAMFVLGAVLIFNGVEIITRVLRDPGREPFVSGLPLSFALCMVEAFRVEKTLRSWLPERLQKRVQRWMQLASCANRADLARERARNLSAVRGGTVYAPRAGVVEPALRELAMSGMTDIVGPRELPPESFGDKLRDLFPPPTNTEAVLPIARKDG